VHLNTYGQIDKKKLDSLSRSIDASTKAHRLFQDSFTKVQDSIYHSAINKNDSGKLNDFLADQKRRVEKEKQQAILRLMIVMILVIGIITLILRRKPKN
jgi:hypothetical protein